MNKYELYNIDCINLSVKNISLVYLDPPYSCKEEDAYYGKESSFDGFINYIVDRLKIIKDCILPDSNVFIHMDYKAIHYIKVEMDKIFGRKNFQNEIIWCFTNPGSPSKWLPRKHQTILWYGMGDYYFNLPRISYTSKLNVGGKTSWSKEKKPVENYYGKGKPLEDWWIDVPAICRNESEKVGYATQKPNKLMTRIIENWSREGDRVLDPFCGSGSFLANAVKLNRYAIGCDENPTAIEITKNRIEKNKQESIYDDEN